MYYRGFDTHGNLLSKKYITKITKREKTREIDIGKFISTLPGYDAFFATVVSVEDINLGVISPRALASCDVITKYAGAHSGSGSGSGPGSDSSARARASAQFQILKELYVPNVSMLGLVETPVGNVAKLLNTVMSCHGHVLIGINRLQDEAGIVHYDIKSMNVIFNTRNKNPIIIDFGLSFFISDVHAALLLPDQEAVVALKQFFYGYFPDYDAWPLEVHVISYIVSTTLHTAASDSLPSGSGSGSGSDDRRPVAVLTADALRGMLDEFMARHSFISYQTDEYKKKFRARATAHFTRTAVGRPGMAVIRELVSDWKAWDFYSVAAMFLDMLEVMRQTYSETDLSPYSAQIGAFSASLQRDAKFI